MVLLGILSPAVGCRCATSRSGDEHSLFLWTKPTACHQASGEPVNMCPPLWLPEDGCRAEQPIAGHWLLHCRAFLCPIRTLSASQAGLGCCEPRESPPAVMELVAWRKVCMWMETLTCWEGALSAPSTFSKETLGTSTCLPEKASCTCLSLLVSLPGSNQVTLGRFQGDTISLSFHSLVVRVVLSRHGTSH